MNRNPSPQVTHTDLRGQHQQNRSSRNDRRPIIGGPTNEEIAVRAFQIYEARGRAPGRDVEDWVQAEQELRWNE